MTLDAIREYLCRDSGSQVLNTLLGRLVAALTGGVPGIAAMAASTIVDKFGFGDGSVDAVKAALVGQSVTLEQLLALKQVDTDFELKMRQAGVAHAESMAGIRVQAEKVAADDRASTRQYAVAEHDHAARNLAYMWTMTLFIMIG